MPAWLLQLLDQPCNVRAARFEIGEGFKPSSRICRRRAQQFRKLVRRPRGKTAECAAGKTSDFTKCLLADLIVSLLKHKCLHIEQAKLAGASTYFSDRFLHCIANKDQYGNLVAFIFASSVGKNLGDLSVTALTAYGRHQRAEPIRICNPWGSSAFAQAAIIDELNVDTASLCRGAEHLGLQLTGMIPHRLPTHCGIERKDQPPPPTRCSARPQRPDRTRERN